MGNVILIDKPKGITSFDVCFKLRKVFNTKKIGHTGTLDPNATGLMMILIDKATKINQFVVSLKKEYIGTVKIGIKTDSEDIDGKILLEKEELMPSKETIEKIFKTFIGKSSQIPPMTSAIKVNGKKLYEYKRNNEEIEIKPRDIEIYELELLDVNDKTFTFRALVSSGTYIRTLAQDILNKLNIIGTLADLRRIAIDDFKVEDAYTLEEINEGKYESLDSYDILSKYYYVYEVTNEFDVLNGKPLKLGLNEDKILCVKDKKALAIYKKDNDIYRCVRGLL